MEFLRSSGIFVPTLKEISLTENKWIVILSGMIFSPPPSPPLSLELYNVEVDAETGEIVGFRKEQAGT
jgi:hypothetical protein